MGEIAKSIRIPLAVNLVYGMGDYSGSLPTERLSYMKNLVAEQVGDRLLARTRPKLTSLVANTSGKSKGRGIMTSASNSRLIVNDDTVYGVGYGATVGTIDSGFRKISGTILGSYLFFTDWQNNKGWTYTGTTLAQVTDADFPATLAGGAVTLNGRCYVMDPAGTIYGSDLDDPTSWNALNFVTAERQPDQGVFLAPHSDHIVALCFTSIEFFYDAANATGSPLTRRNDIAYTGVGARFNDAVSTLGEDIYFIGQERGEIALYRIRGFGLSKVTSSTINKALTRFCALNNQNQIVTSILQDGAKSLIIITLTNISGNDYTTGSVTYAYDIDTGMVSLFSSSFYTPSTSVLPIIGARGPYAAQGQAIYEVLLADGGIYRVITGEGGEGTLGTTAVDIEIRTGWSDGGSNIYKYLREIQIVGQSADDAVLTIKHSDGESADSSFGFTRTVNLLASGKKRKITRAGRFLRRNFQLSASITDDIRLEALDLRVALGDN
jgi:hypothetical protein